MAIDTMEEIIMCEEKAKKIMENAQVFAKQIYDEIVTSSEKDAIKKEQEYKSTLAKEHEELKSKHRLLLKEYEDDVKKEAIALLNNLGKHKASLAQCLAEYILDKG